MAQMLDRPAPDGARSVSWPWYHHLLTTELTPDARTILEKYSGIAPEDVESHIYSVVSKFPRAVDHSLPKSHGRTTVGAETT